MIAQYIDTDHKGWGIHLTQLCITINSATGYFPAFLNFGRELLSPLAIRRQTDDTTRFREQHQGKEVAKDLKKLTYTSNNQGESS